MRIIDFQKNLYNPVLNQVSKGFIDANELAYLKNDCSTGYVMVGMEYRPDLVADYYLGDSSLAWLITFVNDFTNGIKDYTKGKKLKIPKV